MVGWFHRLSDGLSSTRRGLRESLDRFLGRAPDSSLFEELEEALLYADLGVRVVDRLMRQVREQARGAAAATAERSDVTAVPAMGVIAEAMTAFVLAQAALEKFGGDSLAETRRNYDSYISHVADRLRH